MTALPSSLALTSIQTNASILSADHRNNYAAIQTAVNALITALSGGAAGNPLTALSPSSIGYITGANTAYTPTWSTTGTAPVLNNGTLVGNYVQLGKLTLAQVLLTAGSGTTFGTGDFRFTSPATAAAGVFFAGSAEFFDSSANQRYLGSVFTHATTALTAMVPAATGAGSTIINSPANVTNPFTWATSDTALLTYWFWAA